MSIEEILKEREKTHGSFAIHSGVSQQLKVIVHYSGGWLNLNHMQREAVEMILHKIARIIAGNCNTKDHWDDIAGYSFLVSKTLD